MEVGNILYERRRIGKENGKLMIGRVQRNVVDVTVRVRECLLLF